MPSTSAPHSQCIHRLKPTHPLIVSLCTKIDATAAKSHLYDLSEEAPHSGMTKAALYMYAGDADPIVILGGAPAAAIARRCISGDLTPAHSFAAILRSAREHAHIVSKSFVEGPPSENFRCCQIDRVTSLAVAEGRFAVGDVEEKRGTIRLTFGLRATGH